MSDKSKKLRVVGCEEPGETCGKFYAIERCSRNHDHPQKAIKSNCHDRGCQTCYPKIITKEAHKAEERERRIHDEYLKSGVDLGIPVHLVISPPPQLAKFDTPDALNDLYAQAALYAKEIGMVGGAMAFHHKRGSNKEFGLLHKGIIDLDDLKDGPHLHGVGFMPRGHLIKSNEFNAMTRITDERGPNGGYKTGWTYKVIPLRVPKFKTLYHLFKYELSHASFYDSSHMIRWFGICYNGGFRVDKKIMTEEAECKCCKAPVEIVDLGGDFLRYKILKIEIRKYWIPINVVNRCVERYNLPRCAVRGETLLAYAVDA